MLAAHVGRSEGRSHDPAGSISAAESGQADAGGNVLRHMPYSSIVQGLDVLNGRINWPGSDLQQVRQETVESSRRGLGTSYSGMAQPGCSRTIVTPWCHARADHVFMRGSVIAKVSKIIYIYICDRRIADYHIKRQELPLHGWLDKHVLRGACWLLLGMGSALQYSFQLCITM